MAGRKRASAATEKPHKKQKLSRSDAIATVQADERAGKGKHKQTKTAPAEVVETAVSVSTDSSPQEDHALPTPSVVPVARAIELHRHSTKVRSTHPFVLDNTILFPSVCRLFVDDFKQQKLGKAISPDNLKKSAIRQRLRTRFCGIIFEQQVAIK
jgi:hypothetical protein